MAGYSPTGPFVNGSAPGISSAFLNNIENWIQQLEADSGNTHIVGGTNGTADCYEVLQGTFKVVIIMENAFRTGGANQDYTLPVAFTVGGFVLAGDVNNFQLLSASTAQNVDVIVTIASGGGTASAVTTVHADSFGSMLHPFDTIRHSSGSGSNHSGVLVIIGV